VVRLTAALVVCSLLLWGCGGGASAPVAPSSSDSFAQVALSGATQTVTGFTDTAALGTDATGPILPLFAIQNLTTNDGAFNIIAWGTKDASGNVLRIVEAGVSAIATPAQGVHVFFDTVSRPVLFRDDASGYALQLAYNSTNQLSVTLCDPQNALLAKAPIALSAGNAQSGLTTASGSCVVQIAASAAQSARAATTGSGIPTGATDVAATFAGIEQFITAASYLLALNLAESAIVSYQAEKGSPDATSKPILLLFVAAALMFLPTAFKSVAGAVFGPTDATAGGSGFAPFQSPSSLPGCSTAAPSGATCPFP
jgi:intracellular multiplication protein IcmD